MLTPAMLALAWAVWEHGGMLLARAGLDLLDVPGRVCLVVLALSLADPLLDRLPFPHAGHD